MRRTTKSKQQLAKTDAENHPGPYSWRAGRSPKQKLKGDKIMDRTLAGRMVNKVLTSAIRYGKEELGDTWTAQDGSLMACDGARVYKLKFTPLGIKGNAYAENADPLHADAIRLLQQQSEKYIDIYVHDDSFFQTDAPDVEIVKQKIETRKTAEKKATEAATYHFENGPYFNPMYLYDVIRLLPGAKWFITNNPYKPVIAISPDGLALLLPVRIFTGKAKKAA